MTDIILQPNVPASPPGPPMQDIMREALVESRHRWQHLLGLAADFAFETDAEGRFSFIMPETPLGWSRNSLIGQRSELLIGDGADTFNPFRPTVELRRHRAWLRCHDGSLALIAISATPLRDDKGAIVGARGVGINMTDGDEQAARIAGRLRRAEVLRHILTRVGHEAGADAMMDAALLGLDPRAGRRRGCGDRQPVGRQPGRGPA